MPMSIEETVKQCQKDLAQEHREIATALANAIGREIKSGASVNDVNRLADAIEDFLR